jgi:DNA-directed RNA polymerase subunit RPC12/RpoP
MNLYDTKPIYCSKCGKSIGEIEYDSEIGILRCGRCSNPITLEKVSVCV